MAHFPSDPSRRRMVARNEFQHPQSVSSPIASRARVVWSRSGSPPASAPKNHPLDRLMEELTEIVPASANPEQEKVDFLKLTAAVNKRNQQQQSQSPATPQRRLDRKALQDVLPDPATLFGFARKSDSPYRSAAVSPPSSRRYYQHPQYQYRSASTASSPGDSPSLTFQRMRFELAETRNALNEARTQLADSEYRLQCTQLALNQRDAELRHSRQALGEVHGALSRCRAQIHRLQMELQSAHSTVRSARGHDIDIPQTDGQSEGSEQRISFI
ncbi:unnamed protein product, partial [Cyprideis torosa]